MNKQTTTARHLANAGSASAKMRKIMGDRKALELLNELEASGMDELAFAKLKGIRPGRLAIALTRGRELKARIKAMVKR
jgi:hypothetical protein